MLTEPAAISVALVEDDPRTRDRFQRAIGAEPSLKLVLCAGTAAETLAWMQDNLADVLLVDLGLPDLPGLEVIRRVRRLQPSCAVMVITMFGDEAHMLQAFEAGAQGYILKDGSEADLARHVLTLNAGGSPMTPIIARRLLQRWQAAAVPLRADAAAPAAGPTATPPEVALTAREREVLDLVARGFTYPEVAQRIDRSLTTVQTHVRNVYAKLGAHNKAEALFEARQVGLLR